MSNGTNWLTAPDRLVYEGYARQDGCTGGYDQNKTIEIEMTAVRRPVPI